VKANEGSRLDSTARILTVVTVGALLCGLAIAAVKFWGWQLTSSQAVYSDFLESIVNIVAGFVAIFVIRLSSKPADREHPYGHGKIEYFSAAFEGGLIAFAALMIFLEAIPALLEQRLIANLQDGAWIVLSCGFSNFLLGLGMKHFGKKVRSPALLANGLHLQSDFITSVGVTIGLVLARWTGWLWLDPLIAMVAGGQLGWTGFRVVRRSIGGLLDEKDRDILLEFVDVLKSIDFSGVIQIHHTRIIRSGRYHHIDAHAVVPEYWNVAEAHEKTRDFEKRLMEIYPQPGELHLHVDPCRKVYCERCHDKLCPIRAKPFARPLVPDLESLIDPDEPVGFRE
jgi:cation diffusion facilitator family transporter